MGIIQADGLSFGPGHVTRRGPRVPHLLPRRGLRLGTFLCAEVPYYFRREVAPIWQAQQNVLELGISGGLSDLIPQAFGRPSSGHHLDMGRM